jgi:hypothetical protein
VQQPIEMRHKRNPILVDMNSFRDGRKDVHDDFRSDRFSESRNADNIEKIQLLLLQNLSLFSHFLIMERLLLKEFGV